MHDYLTVDGRKISKSSGVNADPAELVSEVGTDAVRWWLLREVPSSQRSVDFTRARLVERADGELAGGLGNLVHRTITMVHRYRGGVVPTTTGISPEVAELERVCAQASASIDAGLADFDFRRATSSVWRIVEEANRAIDATRPWQLAKAERSGDARASGQLDVALAALYRACVSLATCLSPFLPSAAERIDAQCTPRRGVLPESQALFPRIGT